jgi:hypothetical protein
LLPLLMGVLLVSACTFTQLPTGGKSAPVATKPAPQISPKAPSAATGGTSRSAAAVSLSHSLRLLNYYPSGNSWQRMWNNWSATQFNADMAKAASTGANAVRIIVFPYVVGYPTPNAAMTQRLSSAVSIAASHGLSVQLTLYDGWGDYPDQAGSRAWTTAVLTPYRNDQRVALVEVRNEVSPSDPQAMAWVRAQIPLIHSLLPSTPVTVSTASSLGVGGLSALKAALAGAEPDIFDLHYYAQADRAYSTFRQAIAAVAPAPIFVGEAGYSTYVSAATSLQSQVAEAAQADWYRVVEFAAKAAGLAPAAPWTLYDFDAAGAPAGLAGTELDFGLFHIDASAKRAASVVTSAFRGTLTGAPTNGNFADVVAGFLPAAWWSWMPSGVMSVAPGQGVGGDNALALGKTANQAAGITSWYTVPTQVVKPGQTWQASVQARGASSTGLNDLTLGWSDASGRWIGNSTSAALPGASTSWATLSVTAKPPVGATSVRIYLRSEANSGTVYFSRATWSVIPIG